MNILGLLERTDWKLRFVVWFLLTLAANWFWLWTTPKLADGYHNYLDEPLRFFGAPLLIGLLLGWALGLVGRGAFWRLRIAVAIISTAMPSLVVFFMLFFGCAAWNSMGGGYRCGL